MPCFFSHKWEGDTCVRCGKKRVSDRPAASKPVASCAEAHQWESNGCKKKCSVCGMTEGDHDFQKLGGQYWKAGKYGTGQHQNYKCAKCGFEVVMKVSDGAGINSLQAGHFLDFASILGIGPERELNRVVGNPPKEVAFNSDLLKQK